ncbi:MAG: CTP synthase [Candidatus Woesearchaeota archaeon]|jgi:CTP synthase
MKKQTKYIVVTGGVLSGLGKGVVSASIGKLLSDKYTIITIKYDGYLNVDPGTMNPIEHGEVFVLDDGGEVDLDFGHYERFLDITAKHDWSITSGKIIQSLIEKERHGKFLGKTVQIVPHVTGEIRDKLQSIAKKEKADIVLLEIGGTVGDMESEWVLAAVRELMQNIGRENIAFVHLGLIPEVDAMHQQKTKPMQQSINLLQQHGIFPDIIIGRSRRKLEKSTRDKIRWLCNVPENAVISDPDLSTVYELPLIFSQENLHHALAKILSLDVKQDIKPWEKLVHSIKDAKKKVTVAICGKYTEVSDSYISIVEALVHAGAHLDAKPEIVWIETTDFEKDTAAVKKALENIDAMIVPGGFGTRGIEGKIAAITYARENNIPFLGICYGLQLAVIEFARNMCDLKDANTTEVDEHAKEPVVDILPEQKKVTQLGGTMRLGACEAVVDPTTKVAALYKQWRGSDTKATERHRHRYEVNPDYHKKLLGKSLIFSGTSADKRLVEFIELTDHPYFVATQGHPELKSRLESPAPLFYGLIEAALKKK